MAGFIGLTGCLEFDTTNPIDAPPQLVETELPAEMPQAGQEQEPEAAPTPAPVTSSGGFRWEPRSDSVRVVIPASLPHWQFHVFSRTRHATLYGPDSRGGNRAQDIEYILPGSGDTWRNRSLAAGDDGSVLVYINTQDVATGSHRSAGWRIMDPRQAQSGDGNRLKVGEDR